LREGEGWKTSKQENGVTIQLEEKVYQLLEKEGKKDDLTVAQELELATLYFLRENDPKLLEEAKQKADLAVLRVFERETA